MSYTHQMEEIDLLEAKKRQLQSREEELRVTEREIEEYEKEIERMERDVLYKQNLTQTDNMQHISGVSSPNTESTGEIPSTQVKNTTGSVEMSLPIKKLIKVQRTGTFGKKEFQEEKDKFMRNN